MNKSIRILIALIVISSLVIPRLANLTAFTAADEPFWLAVGADFYYALTHREFENTVYEYHPAVTTMWIVTAAMLVYFPEYRSLMNGYFQQEKTSFDMYLVEHGKNPLDLLWWSRLIQMLINVFLWLAVFLYLRYLLDKWTALAVLMIASFAPYLFGQSRMLNHETMLGLFSLNSLLTMVAYLFRARKPAFLFLSALAAALANLTKSSSIILLPVTACIILFWGITEWRAKKLIWTSIGNGSGIFLAWLGLIIVFYVIIWPGMWVAPGKMLYEVYGNAFSYAFQGARLSVTTKIAPSNFGLTAPLRGIWSFLVSIAWRTTPITWAGLVLALGLFFQRSWGEVPAQAKWLIGFMLLEAFSSVAMFGTIKGRNSPHYVLTAYVCLEAVAALGWVYAVRGLGHIFERVRKPFVQAALLGLVLLAQAAGLFSTSPYFYSYKSPIMLALKNGKAPAFFYGEGMEQAAAYLSSKPNAQNVTALVYFGRTFSYYFPGKTMIFKPILFDDKPQLIGDLRQADYLVMYTGFQERLPLLKEMTPEHIIYLNGRKYVEIFRVSNVPASFYESDN
jgi:4-amino-4-deoxy-L-arabinose transferase-like glycosyltransferase